MATVPASLSREITLNRPKPRENSRFGFLARRLRFDPAHGGLAANTCGWESQSIEKSSPRIESTAFHDLPGTLNQVLEQS